MTRLVNFLRLMKRSACLLHGSALEPTNLFSIIHLEKCLTRSQFGGVVCALLPADAPFTQVLLFAQPYLYCSWLADPCVIQVALKVARQAARDFTNGMNFACRTGHLKHRSCRRVVPRDIVHLMAFY